MFGFRVVYKKRLDELEAETAEMGRKIKDLYAQLALAEELAEKSDDITAILLARIHIRMMGGDAWPDVYQDLTKDLPEETAEKLAKYLKRDKILWHDTHDSLYLNAVPTIKFPT